MTFRRCRCRGELAGAEQRVQSLRATNPGGAGVLDHHRDQERVADGRHTREGNQILAASEGHHQVADDVEVQVELPPGERGGRRRPFGPVRI